MIYPISIRRNNNEIDEEHNVIKQVQMIHIAALVKKKLFNYKKSTSSQKATLFYSSAVLK